MLRQSLNGKWTLELINGTGRNKIKVPASVPGDAYRDLLKAKKIADPYYRDNEKQCLWIGESDWLYSREFTASDALLKRDRVVLKCHGLDTIATVKINGKKVASTDNMFRVWEWDAKPMLKAGKNLIQVAFASPVKYCEKQRNAFTRANPEIRGGDLSRWIRKEPCNFGWDWGLSAVTSGIWRDIELLAFDEARISDVAVVQRHPARNAEQRTRTEKPVHINVNVDLEHFSEEMLTIRVALSRKGHVVAEKQQRTKSQSTKLGLTVVNPDLWWPNNMGDQALYDLTIELCGPGDKVLDTRTKRIGLRTLRLDRHKDKWGESFQFVVNGIPFFAKGANWIPSDAILSRMTEKHYRILLEASAEVNMNMLRVWGGGIYEDDVFYELCDELGICVWQDFMFACNQYPTFDKDFMANVEAEAEDNIKRLRHHPCIALWCGNNELEMLNVEKGKFMGGWKGYGKLFDRLLPDIVKTLDPQRDYWPSSPHTPHGDRKNHEDPTCGDAHLWAVWHGRRPFEWYRTCKHRFNSEFGFQSFPEPRTVNGFTVKDDRNITSPIMEHHQRSGIGNTTIMQYMLDWFRLPQGFDNTLWASQILQGMAMKYAVEHWRRSMPRGMGTLYWQLNDCWPVASWSSIDFHGRWKALQYMAKDFFAPVLISGLEDKKKGTVEIHITSDRLKALDASVSWVVTDVAGKRLSAGAKNVRTPVNGNRRIETLRLKQLLKEQGAENLVVWLEMKIKGEARQRNLVLLARPKQLDLSRSTGITTTVKDHKDGTYTLTVKSKRVTLWNWIEVKGVDADLSNNFFHLRPGISEKVRIRPSRCLTKTQLRQKLSIKSLVDTY